MEKGDFGNMVNMGEEGESGVQDNSKVMILVEGVMVEPSMFRVKF